MHRVISTCLKTSSGCCVMNVTVSHCFLLASHCVLLLFPFGLKNSSKTHQTAW